MKDSAAVIRLLGKECMDGLAMSVTHKGRERDICMSCVYHICHGGHSPSLDEKCPFLDLQALPAQGYWLELHDDGQGPGSGIASSHLVSESPAIWSSGASSPSAKSPDAADKFLKWMGFHGLP